MNIKSWVALDEDNNEVFVDDAIPQKDYICPICKSILRLRAKGSSKVSEHFYHLNKSECDGESLLHIYWKNKLIEIGEVIYLPTIGNIKCIDKRVEFRFNTSTGLYQPDLVLKTDNNDYKFIIIEIYNTNKKIVEEYYDKWQELKYPVFEIRVKKLHKDRSNLEDNIKILYDKNRDKFINDNKKSIKNIYEIVKQQKWVEYDKDLEWMFEEKGHYVNIYDKDSLIPILNKFYKIFKNNLNTKVDLRILNQEINKYYKDKPTYINIILPLQKIYKDLTTYIY